MTLFRYIALPAQPSAEMPATPVPEPMPALEDATRIEAVPTAAQPTHLLHFEPLAAQGTSFDIPCDPQGQVGLDALDDKARNDYFFARALIGCLFAKPIVKQPCR